MPTHIQPPPLNSADPINVEYILHYIYIMQEQEQLVDIPKAYGYLLDKSRLSIESLVKELDDPTKKNKFFLDFDKSTRIIQYLHQVALQRNETSNTEKLKALESEANALKRARSRFLSQVASSKRRKDAQHTQSSEAADAADAPATNPQSQTTQPLPPLQTLSQSQEQTPASSPETETGAIQQTQGQTQEEAITTGSPETVTEAIQQTQGQTQEEAITTSSPETATEAIQQTQGQTQEEAITTGSPETAAETIQQPQPREYKPASTPETSPEVTTQQEQKRKSYAQIAASGRSKSKDTTNAPRAVTESSRMQVQPPKAIESPNPTTSTKQAAHTTSKGYIIPRQNLVRQKAVKPTAKPSERPMVRPMVKPSHIAPAPLAVEPEVKPDIKPDIKPRVEALVVKETTKVETTDKKPDRIPDSSSTKPSPKKQARKPQGKKSDSATETRLPIYGVVPSCTTTKDFITFINDNIKMLNAQVTILAGSVSSSSGYEETIAQALNKSSQIFATVNAHETLISHSINVISSVPKQASTTSQTDIKDAQVKLTLISMCLKNLGENIKALFANESLIEFFEKPTLKDAMQMLQQQIYRFLESNLMSRTIRLPEPSLCYFIFLYLKISEYTSLETTKKLFLSKSVKVFIKSADFKRDFIYNSSISKETKLLIVNNIMELFWDNCDRDFSVDQVIVELAKTIDIKEIKQVNESLRLLILLNDYFETKLAFIRRFVDRDEQKQKIEKKLATTMFIENIYDQRTTLTHFINVLSIIIRRQTELPRDFKQGLASFEKLFVKFIDFLALCKLSELIHFKAEEPIVKFIFMLSLIMDKVPEYSPPESTIEHLATIMVFCPEITKAIQDNTFEDCHDDIPTFKIIQHICHDIVFRCIKVREKIESDDIRQTPIEEPQNVFACLSLLSENIILVSHKSMDPDEAATIANDYCQYVNSIVDKAFTTNIDKLYAKAITEITTIEDKHRWQNVEVLIKLCAQFMACFDTRKVEQLKLALNRLLPDDPSCSPSKLETITTTLDLLEKCHQKLREIPQGIEDVIKKEAEKQLKGHTAVAVPVTTSTAKAPVAQTLCLQVANPTPAM